MPGFRDPRKKLSAWWFTVHPFEADCTVYRRLGVLGFKRAFMSTVGRLLKLDSYRLADGRRASLRRLVRWTKVHEAYHLAIASSTLAWWLLLLVRQQRFSVELFLLGPVLNGYLVMMQRMNRARAVKLLGRSATRRGADSPEGKPDIERLQSELAVFEVMTAGFVGSITRAARALPEGSWNWSFSHRTPSPREVCEHAYVWLWCDRQQITVLDRMSHRRVPDLPPDRDSMVRLLEQEAEEWRCLVRSLKPEQLLDERESWDGERRNLRSFLFHSGQNLIYKAGQIWTLAYGMGVDGDAPYDAPHPDRMYGFQDAPPWPKPRA